METQRTARDWIGGEWVEGGTRRESTNPANGNCIGSYFDADAAVAQSAIDAHRQLSSRKAGVPTR